MRTRFMVVRAIPHAGQFDPGPRPRGGGEAHGWGGRDFGGGSFRGSGFRGGGGFRQ